MDVEAACKQDGTACTAPRSAAHRPATGAMDVEAACKQDGTACTAPRSAAHRPATVAMDVETACKQDDLTPTARRGKAMHRLMVALNCGMLALGTTAGPLLTRLYYDKGGQREWLSSCLQSVGWPLLLIPVAASYAARRARDGAAAPVLLTPPRVLLAAVGLGVATGADNFIYSYSLRYLPVSTSAILISTQLAFTVFFAFLIVRQRLTPATVNAVALLTVGAAVLGLHVSSDRPAGVARAKYLLGFALALAAAALYGLILPLVELAYRRAAGGGRAVTYALVMEMQLVMGFFATAFCTAGMIINKDFQVRARISHMSPTVPLLIDSPRRPRWSAWCPHSPMSFA